MKRIIFILMAVCLLIGTKAFAEANYRSVTSAISATDDTSVFLTGGTNIVYTKAFSVKNVKNDNDIGIMYKATSPGAVDIKLDTEGSYTPPATEGSADTNYLHIGTIDASITDESWHLATIDSVVLTYMRFKVTGQGSNAATTTFQIKISK